MNDITHYNHGSTVTGTSSRTPPVHNPATGDSDKNVLLASISGVETAVAAAKATWFKTPALRRGRVLDRFKTILRMRAEELADSLIAEHGKTRDDALGEVSGGLEMLGFATSVPSVLKGDFSEDVAIGADNHTIHQSQSVYEGVTALQYPDMVPMWMFPVSLAFGNTCLPKPSERVPSASLAMAEWLGEAGLPDGVFNVVQGDKKAVGALLKHPEVKAVSLVDTTPIARHFHTAGTSKDKRFQALSGAENHTLIPPDADPDMTANALLGAAYRIAVERCMATPVAVLVSDAVADALIEKPGLRINALRIDPTSDSDSDMGPLVTAQYREHVSGYIDAGESNDAKMVVDGRHHRQDGQVFGNGYHNGGTLMDIIMSDMSVWKNESVGPVPSVVRRDSYQDALDLAHSHGFANGTAIFTRDGDTARDISQELDMGMIGINVSIPVFMALPGFGGWQSSIFGDHHRQGMEGGTFKRASTRQRPADAMVPVVMLNSSFRH